MKEEIKALEIEDNLSFLLEEDEKTDQIDEDKRLFKELQYKHIMMAIDFEELKGWAEKAIK